MARHKTRRNPSTAIASDWPQDLWRWGPRPTYANWTSYPTYAYQQFYRQNPRVARKNEGEIDVPTSSAEARAIPWAYAQNAGPFLPEMFPYGQGGRPYVYANPRGRRKVSRRGLEEEEDLCEQCGEVLAVGEYDICDLCLEESEEDEDEDDDFDYAYDNRGRRGGFTPRERSSLPNWYFLKPRGRGWPAGDPRRGKRDEFHAIEVIRYMDRGFGNRSEYPALIMELARRYPVGAKENKNIWLLYQDLYESIARKSTRRLPTLAQLRKRV